MSRRHHLEDAIPRWLRGPRLIFGAVLLVIVAFGVNGQVERSSRTDAAYAHIDSLVRQQSTTFVSAAFVIEYSFEVGGAVMHRSTTLKASQWSSQDRFGIVCYDPSDLNNQVLLPADEHCPG